MPGICIHCALDDLVRADEESGGTLTKSPVGMGLFSESQEEHLRMKHPRGVDPAERRELERKAAAIVQRIEGGRPR